MSIASDTVHETLGQRLVFARERVGLSTAQAARRLGVKTRSLTRWERDESEPRPNRLVMLAQMLGVSPAWLLEGSDSFEPRHAEPGLADIKDQLAAAKRAIEALSGIVDDLTLMVERKTQEMSRNAA
ncbi:MAG: helix-turn-helix domain-containing protein [Kiloniellales bacterium]|nr:helix-turn-helix domain-containing protein [Kiloniellales bacterium]